MIKPRTAVEHMQVTSKFVQLLTTNAEHFQAKRCWRSRNGERTILSPRSTLQSWKLTTRPALTNRYSETGSWTTLAWLVRALRDDDDGSAFLSGIVIVVQMNWCAVHCRDKAWDIISGWPINTKQTDCIKFSSTRTIEARRCERPAGAPEDDKGTGNAMGRCWLQTSHAQNCKMNRSIVIIINVYLRWQHYIPSNNIRMPLYDIR